MGWGMAVIYVGQQTWGRTPGQKVAVTRYVTKRVRQVKTRNGKRVVRYVKKRVPVRVIVTPRASRGATCSTQFVSAARGTADANDAIAKTAAEGFARGTVIFLDIERMQFVPKAMRDYYRAWTQRVLEDGRFRPAYYTHSHNANLIYRDVKQVLAGAGVSDDPHFWIASERGFSIDKAPEEVGHDVRQGMAGDSGRRRDPQRCQAADRHERRAPSRLRPSTIRAESSVRYLTRVMKSSRWGGRNIRSTASQVVLANG